MSLTKLLRDKVDKRCVTHDCRGCSRKIRKEGASFSLQGAPAPHILVDFDKLGLSQNEPCCDYLFAAHGKGGKSGYVVPIEMTSGKKDASKVKEQLQAGAHFAGKSIPHGRKAEFVPVLLES